VGSQRERQHKCDGPIEGRALTKKTEHGSLLDIRRHNSGTKRCIRPWLI
jgi:hypothetical protein